MGMQGAHIFVQGRLHGVRDRLDSLVTQAGAKLARRLSTKVTHTVITHAVASDFARRRAAGESISELAFKRLLGLAPQPTTAGRTFSKEDVVRLSGLDPAFIDRLILFDILDPVDGSYCFKDVASAREVARLLQEGATEADIVATGSRLRDRGLRVSEARLCGAPWGGLMLGWDAQLTTIEGQFALDLGDVLPDPDDLFGRALAHEEDGDLGKAEGLYRVLARLDRADPVAPFNLGNVLRQQGRHEEALLAFEEAFRRDTSSPDPLYNMALIKSAKGDEDGAEECYREALKIDPEHGFARYNLALMLTNSGRFGEALPLWTAIAQPETDDRDMARKAALLCRLEMRAGAAASGSPEVLR